MIEGRAGVKGRRDARPTGLRISRPSIDLEKSEESPFIFPEIVLKNLIANGRW